MIGAPVNLLDAAVLIILVLSAIVAFFRGFIRELLSLGAWVGAAIITLYLYPHSFDFMKQHVNTRNEHIVGAISAIGTYMAALISISILNSIIIRYVKSGVEVGILDNFLGLVFGSLRGVFIVSLGYLIVTTIVSKDNPPEWITSSFTKDYLQMGANVLVKVAPEYLNDIEGMVKKSEEPQKDQDDTNDNGYKPENQKDFNRLMDSTQPRGTGANHN
jgi:membrane protein required for colicin V production